MQNNEEEIKEIQKDLIHASEIDVMAHTKGGQVVLDSLLKDIINSIDSMLTQRSELSHEKYISIACDIKSKLDVIKLFKRSEYNKQFLQDTLEKALGK